MSLSNFWMCCNKNESILTGLMDIPVEMERLGL